MEDSVPEICSVNHQERQKQRKWAKKSVGEVSVRRGHWRWEQNWSAMVHIDVKFSACYYTLVQRPR